MVWNYIAYIFNLFEACDMSRDFILKVNKRLKGRIMHETSFILTGILLNIKKFTVWLATYASEFFMSFALLLKSKLLIVFWVSESMGLTQPLSTLVMYCWWSTRYHHYLSGIGGHIHNQIHCTAQNFYGGNFNVFDSFYN